MNQSALNLQQDLRQINEQLKTQGYEIIIRRIPTKAVVAFDIGITVTKDSDIFELYMDGDLKELLQALAAQHGKVHIKVNFFSPDVTLIAAPPDLPLVA